MSLLDSGAWQGQVFTGEWTAGADRSAVVEPATGGELGSLGLASVEQAVEAADRAARAQRDWAATPYLERAAVLQKAAALMRDFTTSVSASVGQTKCRVSRQPERSAVSRIPTFHVESG